MLGKIEGGWKEKTVSEDEMAGWYHQCNGCELEQTLEDDEGQGSLACCSTWGRKELDVTERLNNQQALGMKPPFPHPRLLD